MGFAVEKQKLRDFDNSCVGRGDREKKASPTLFSGLATKEMIE